MIIGIWHETSILYKYYICLTIHCPHCSYKWYLKKIQYLSGSWLIWGRVCLGYQSTVIYFAQSLCWNSAKFTLGSWKFSIKQLQLAICSSPQTAQFNLVIKLDITETEVILDKQIPGSDYTKWVKNHPRICGEAMMSLSCYFLFGQL